MQASSRCPRLPRVLRSYGAGILAHPTPVPPGGQQASPPSLPAAAYDPLPLDEFSPEALGDLRAAVLVGCALVPPRPAAGGFAAAPGAPEGGAGAGARDGAATAAAAAAARQEEQEESFNPLLVRALRCVGDVRWPLLLVRPGGRFAARVAACQRRRGRGGPQMRPWRRCGAAEGLAACLTSAAQEARYRAAPLLISAQVFASAPQHVLGLLAPLHEVPPELGRAASGALVPLLTGRWGA